MIPGRKHHETFSEVYTKFGGYTLLPSRVGLWRNDEGISIKDKCSPLIIDISANSLEWFSKAKKRWETKYKQDVLYIINYSINQMI